jgi:hypothetical protein
VARTGRMPPSRGPRSARSVVVLSLPVRAMVVSTTGVIKSLGGAAQRIAQRSEDVDIDPQRCAGDEPVDVFAGNVDPAGLQQRQQLAGLEDPTVGHDLAQVPLHRDMPAHQRAPSGSFG